MPEPRSDALLAAAALEAALAILQLTEERGGAVEVGASPAAPPQLLKGAAPAGGADSAGHEPELPADEAAGPLTQRKVRGLQGRSAAADWGRRLSPFC